MLQKNNNFLPKVAKVPSADMPVEFFVVKCAPNGYLVASDDGLHGQVIVNKFVINAAAGERLSLSTADRERRSTNVLRCRDVISWQWSQ